MGGKFQNFRMRCQLFENFLDKKGGNFQNFRLCRQLFENFLDKKRL